MSVLFFLAMSCLFAAAQSPAEISMDLQADTFYVQPGGTFTVSFDLYNPMPSNDNVLDRVDLYLLNAREQGFTVAGWGNTGWEHAFVERFGDEQFWITNATNQRLEIVLKAGENAKSGTIEGFYSFNKTAGTPFLKDHSEFLLSVNVVKDSQSVLPPAKTQITKKEQDANSAILALGILVVVLAGIIVFLLFGKKSALLKDGRFAHKKK